MKKKIKKRAFISNAGLWEFNVMPFGLCNAPATFQRLMDNVLRDPEWEAGRDYINDVIIGSSKFKNHLWDMTNLFKKLRKANLKVKLNKCAFGMKKVIYLGHELLAEGVRPNPKKVEAIDRMQPPVDISGLRRFLGLTSYYQKFIYKYADVAEPLNQLLCKGKIYKWDTKCQKAFEELKNRLVTAPILTYPDFNKVFYLQTDASDFGLEVVLARKDNKRKDKVVAYASRSLTKTERNYLVTEKECLAIIWGVKIFRPYLYGRKFIAITDHSALTWLKTMKEPQ